QSNTLKNKEIPRRIKEIINLIYNKVLNKIENISSLDQFIIGTSGGGKLTKNIYILEELKNHITKIKTIYEETNENYYQDIINRIKLLTDKEEFKDNKKFDKKICILDNKYLKKDKKMDDKTTITISDDDNSLQKLYKNIIIATKH
ncbi:8079_t:CDS:2, partial [Gigaspora margarita]